MNSIAEVMAQYVANIEGKKALSFWALLGKAIMAGAMIAFGAAASSVAAHAVTNVGVARLIAGAVFPVGLMMVILMGAELFTGDCMLAVGVPAKNLTPAKCFTMLLIIYFGNMIGGVLISALTYFSGQYNYSAGLLGAYTIKVAAGKTAISFGTGIASGILCNILVCGAVLMAMCSKDVTGKLFASFFVILAFVVSGFEHCVANMYYIPAGLLCKMNANYVEVAKETYNMSQATLDQLSVGNFFLHNLLPVTIGNFLGGAVFLAIPLYYLNRAKKAPNQK